MSRFELLREKERLAEKGSALNIEKARTLEHEACALIATAVELRICASVPGKRLCPRIRQQYEMARIKTKLLTPKIQKFAKEKAELQMAFANYNLQNSKHFGPL